MPASKKIGNYSQEAILVLKKRLKWAFSIRNEAVQIYCREYQNCLKLHEAV